MDTADDLIGDLTLYRDIHFAEPADVSDGEIRRVAEWAWKLRITNSVWAGRQSGVNIQRSIADRLLAQAGGSDAFSLFFILKANFGHTPGYRFAIVPDAMRKAGLISLCRNHIRAAIQLLIDEGLLVKHPPRRLGKPCEYQLTGGPILPGQGRGVSSYIVTQIGTREIGGVFAA